MKINVYTFIPKTVAIVLIVVGSLLFYFNSSGLIGGLFDDIFLNKVDGVVSSYAENRERAGEISVKYLFSLDGNEHTGNSVISVDSGIDEVRNRLNKVLELEQPVVVYADASGDYSKIDTSSFIGKDNVIRGVLFLGLFLMLSIFIYLKGACLLLKISFSAKEPWRTYSIFGDNRIVGGVAHKLIPLWIICVLWLIVGVLICRFAIPVIAESDKLELHKLMYFFPYMGFFLVIHCVAQTLRWFKYGKATLILHQFPPVFYGAVSGAMVVNRRHDLFSSYKLSLACYGEKYKSNFLFGRGCQVNVYASNGKTVIDFNIDLSEIPDEFVSVNKETEVKWFLELLGDLPDMSPLYRFAIPVCTNVVSSQTFTRDIQRTEDGVVDQGFGFSHSIKDNVEEYTCHEVNGFRGAVIAIASAICFGFVSYVLTGAIPVFAEESMLMAVMIGFFTFIFAAVGPLIMWGIFMSIIKTRKILLGSDNLIIRKTVFGKIKNEIRFSFNEISEINVELHRDGGASSTRKGKPWDNGLAKKGHSYDVVLKNLDDKEFILFDDISESVACYLKERIAVEVESTATY